MSKKSIKQTNKQLNNNNIKSKVNSLNINENSLLELFVGSLNVKRWITLKTTFSCDTNEKFITKLLDIAQEYINRNPCKEQNETINFKKDNQNQTNKKKRKKNQNKTKVKSDEIKSVIESKNEGIETNLQVQNVNEQKTVISDINVCLIETNQPAEGCVDSKTVELSTNIATKTDEKKKTNKKTLSENNKTPTKKDNKNGEIKKKTEQHDIRKAPELDVQIENKFDKCEDDLISNEDDDTKNRVAIKIKHCQNCGTRHIQDHCPLNYPNFIITDSITFNEWEEKYQTLYYEQQQQNEQLDDNNNNDKFSFAKLSLPNFLQLIETNTDHGLGVLTNIDIQEFTQFGPIIGKVVKEVDISEDSTMRDLWEINTENCTNNIYFNTEDLELSNWMRFVRPAITRDDKNVTVITKQNKLYFVSIKSIKSGEELFYWQDCSVITNKKKLEKNACGGCNMTFAHPLYYRTHCSVFHDIRYSLTIRKYHCKICGVAVLGKENIMKHAAELHNGQGAYQCQFCKKFFLRLNYLEMHRTYGCSANPHRSRPLCDFCGRKFCQPQKLKVHIKRMHSDFSEVLKEFQCKNCLKILGSRAALQRHSKEVHQKQLDGACSCIKCGKHFQNKSNLKIHMLTHSGIKPFRCVVKTCNAAFTTKQCLQFHYKKVHNFNEDLMPKIERSVDYTFEAYSGLEDQELDKIDDNKIDEDLQQNHSKSALLDEDSDIDDASMDSKSVDDPLIISSPPPPAEPLQEVQNSPEQLTSNSSPPPPPAPPIIDSYNNSTNSMYTTMKILSKGSKKWIGDDQLIQPTTTTKQDIYHHIEQRLCTTTTTTTNVNLQLQDYERKITNNNNLTDFNHRHHETSNASLLVEAALDSVCSEPNIDIVDSTTNDNLVNNLYNLTDVTTNYNNETVCINDSRDINLISPSVHDHISVTDDLGGEQNHHQLDYSSFHQEDFNSPSAGNNSSPTDLQQERNNFVRNYINNLSPTNADDSYNQQQHEKNLSSSSPVAIVSSNNNNDSPIPRYDFGHTTATTTEHLSSDDNSNNGMSAQNLSLHSKQQQQHDNIQLDLSIYNNRSTLQNFQLRNKFKQIYNLEIENNMKSYRDEINDNILTTTTNTTIQVDDDDDNDDEDKKILDDNHKYPSIDLIKYHSTPDTTLIDTIRNNNNNKFDSIDLDLRIKNYDLIDNDNLRIINSRTLYDTTDLNDFRTKNYDLIDNLDRNSIESSTIDFRTTTSTTNDRNFEPLIINSSELQGLDMSARSSFHNYSNLNRYHHHLYAPPPPPPPPPDPVISDRVDLRLNYSPTTPCASYATHADILRVVSLDLTPPGRHSVDLTLRSHSLHQIGTPTTRLLSDHTIQTNPHHRLIEQTRLLSSTDLRHLSNSTSSESTTSRLLNETTSSGGRILSDHTTNRLLSNTNEQITNILSTTAEQRLISNDTTTRLLEQSRLISSDGRILVQPSPPSTPNGGGGGGSVSSVPTFSGYSVTQSPYHPTAIAPRSHVTSPTPTAYHHYSTYY